MDRRIVLGVLVGAVVTLGVAVIAPPPHANAARQTAATATGTIAYVRNLGELHLIQPDGSNDHVIWTEPPASNNLSNYILDPAWRPDSGEIAFESSHGQTTSIYNTDIYGIAPDGSGLRRITNPPDASRFANFPKGSVHLSVVNHNDSDSLFVVYIAGAPQMQPVTVNAGHTATVDFSNVAVFTGKAQFPVALDGVTRWIGSGAQLSPGGTVNAQVDIYAASGHDYFGARDPVWRSDGAELDDYLGQGCVGEGWPASAPAGTSSAGLLQFAQGICPFDRGPTAALANDVLYWNNYDLNNGGDGEMYQTTEGSSNPGTLIIDTGYSSFVYDVHYLPDGSGFLWTEKVSASDSSSNFYRYDFGSGSWTQLTNFTGAFAGHFSISPDGQEIVFEHSTQDPMGSADTPADLWLMKIDGTIVKQPLVANASYPSWSAGAPWSPPPTPPPTPMPTATPRPVAGSDYLYLPLILR